jgi:RNA-directed DNA polymerase
MHRNSNRENREIPEVSAHDEAERADNQTWVTSATHADGNSDESIVPAKLANNAAAEPPGDAEAAESVEGRDSRKGNVQRANLDRAQPRKQRSSGLLGIRERAAKDRNAQFSNLMHHITPELLHSSFLDLRKAAAPGVDEVTWVQYAQRLEDHIEDLHVRVQSGAYRAKPSKRAYILKSDGKLRPLGIASLEDKIVQRAVRTVLEQIYELDFLGFSYGYRPRRGAHDALDALSYVIKRRNVNWILDADIRGFFDNLNHEWLMKFLEHRVQDRRMLRLIRKWLKAGVSEDGAWSPTEVGTPQGAVISPLLANVYLHYVLDLWVNQWRKREAVGQIYIVRYADDFVIGFSHHADALALKQQLGERLGRFDLELHPGKTRLIEFGRYAESRRRDRGEDKPESFDFLGFNHRCGRTRRRGYFTVDRITVAKRMCTTLAEIKKKLKQRMHDPLYQTGIWLRQVVRGWYQYYAVPGNWDRLEQFRTAVAKLWRQAIHRRSQKARVRWTWPRLSRLFASYLPAKQILHPYPDDRFLGRPARGAV